MKTEDQIPAAGSYLESTLTIEQALRDLLADINAGEMWRDLESGCNGDGPVVRAYRALGEKLPTALDSWLTEEDGGEDDEDEDSDLGE